MHALQWKRKGQVSVTNKFLNMWKHWWEQFIIIKVCVYLWNLLFLYIILLQLQPLSWARIKAMWHMSWQTTASGLHQRHCEMVLFPYYGLFVRTARLKQWIDLKFINIYDYLYCSVFLKSNWISTFCSYFQGQQLWQLCCWTIERTTGGQPQQGVRQGAFQRLSVHGKR